MNKNDQFQTPLLFVIFNRPEMTKKVFEQIRKLKPMRLYIAADGPRENNKTDTKNCMLTRDVVSKVDWPCEVKTLFQEKNLGCKYAVTAAFDWFFDNVEEGIILEDDDLPDPSFFNFCSILLERYRDNPRIMHISGINFQQKNKNFKPKESYYFSRIPHIWGWASWKRAWKLNSVEVESWPEMRAKRTLTQIFKDKAVAFFWGKKFQKYYEGKINSYDGQWVFTCLKHNGLCINPSVNLVSNIGFGSESTHTSTKSDFAELKTHPIIFPLKHPAEIEVNEDADRYTHKYAFEINKTKLQKLKWFFKLNFTRPYLITKKIFYKLFLDKNLHDDAHLMLFFK